MRIFYYCYDTDRPSGGQKHTYEHVDILNRNGYEAYALHHRDDFRLSWFTNDTAVIGDDLFRKLYDRTQDYCVFPEDLGPRILEYPGRKIIFNKNIYYGFRALAQQAVDPYLDPEVVAVFTVSDHNAGYLQFAYPQQSIHRVVLKIDTRIFEYRPLIAKKKQIACSTKAPLLTQSLLQILKARAAAGLNIFDEYQVVMLERMTEREMARTLGESLMLVFLGVEEGLGRVPLEGLSCGCIIIAFTAGPLEETLPAFYRADYGDILSLVQRMEKTMAGFPDAIPFRDEQIIRARKYSLRYSEKMQEQSVLAAWQSVLRR